MRVGSFIKNSNCSREEGRTVSICVILVKGEYIAIKDRFLQKVAVGLMKSLGATGDSYYPGRHKRSRH